LRRNLVKDTTAFLIGTELGLEVSLSNSCTNA